MRKLLSFFCASCVLSDCTRSFNSYQGIPGPGMVNGNCTDLADLVTCLYSVFFSLSLSLSLSLSSLLLPNLLHVHVCSLPQVSSPFLTLAVLSFTPAIVRSSLPSLSLALHRVYDRTTASVWLTVYLKISIRLTRRGFKSVPNHRNCCSFPVDLSSSVNWDNEKKLRTVSFFCDKGWKRMLGM